VATESYHHLGFDETDLTIQVFAAGAYLAGVWVAITWRSAFHHVGDVYLLTTEINGCQEFLQELTGRTHKGTSLLILIETGPLTNEHQISVLRAFTGDSICPTFSKTAIVTATYLANYVFKFRHRLKAIA
jgi:hypothetical protein|tara:strand:- start:484 stop:873 length:390 start_codon:yes stop_codon:yes gene_type:complete